MPAAGSSPRVWGTVIRHAHDECDPRFIPTRVGNRNGCPRLTSSTSVHPHACGEQLGSAFRGYRDAGSSPRVWGTGDPLARHHLVLRFIPTRVGNRRTYCRSRSMMAVHPHACGEQHVSAARVQICRGSSPRVWGTGERLQRFSDIWRFIPTRVGNSVGAPHRRTLPTVHPHACGEQARAKREERPGNGSSPRVWGTA